MALVRSTIPNVVTSAAPRVRQDERSADWDACVRFIRLRAHRVQLRWRPRAACR